MAHVQVADDVVPEVDACLRQTLQRLQFQEVQDGVQRLRGQSVDARAAEAGRLAHEAPDRPYQRRLDVSGQVGDALQQLVQAEAPRRSFRFDELVHREANARRLAAEAQRQAQGASTQHSPRDERHSLFGEVQQLQVERSIFGVRVRLELRER